MSKVGVVFRLPSGREAVLESVEQPGVVRMRYIDGEREAVTLTRKFFEKLEGRLK